MERTHPKSGPVTSGFYFFLLAAATVATTRFGGGVAFIWVATAFLFARLKLTPRKTWAPTLLWCGIASIVATTFAGTGPVAAVPLAIINLAEAVIGVLVLKRLVPQPRALETLHGSLLFIFSVGVVAPAATAPLAAAVIAAVTGTDFLANSLRWYTGHALGVVAFAPIFIMSMRGDVRRWARSLTLARSTEAFLLLFAVAAAALVVFNQNRLPLLFLPILPVMAAIFRFGSFGGAISVLTVTTIGAACTLAGNGPATFAGGAVGDHLQFLQFYIAVLVMIALPVAADLTQRERLTAKLGESEAQFRLLAQHSTDVILSLSPDGRIRFASKAIERLGGYRPDQLVGSKASAFVVDEDVGKVLDAFRSAFQSPETTTKIEYRCKASDGAPVWVEAHVQALTNESGQLDGLVTVLRGTAERRNREQQLARQAVTDPLTGLCNRRGFFNAVDAWLKAPKGGVGCFALFDLDHFKRINDQFGHQVGDAVLVDFAELMRSTLRDNDELGRIGGEEFGVLLRGATQEQAAAVCERLRINCYRRTMRIAGGKPVRFTASAGIVVLKPGMTRGEIYSAADTALYRAKEGGRNRVALAA